MASAERCIFSLFLQRYLNSIYSLTAGAYLSDQQASDYDETDAVVFTYKAKPWSENILVGR
jgi:hypothetical protein